MRYMIIGWLAGLLLAALVLAYPGPVHADKDEVVICHAAGQAGTTKFVTLKLPTKAVFGKAGHFNENGTTKAGHEDDYLGPCITTTTEVKPTTTTSPPTTAATTTTTPQSTSTVAPTTTVVASTSTSSTTVSSSPSSVPSQTTVVASTTSPTTSTLVSTSSSTPPSTLAETGAAQGALAALASLLLFAGIGAVYAARR